MIYRIYIILFFILLISCGYPDIDNVPNFDEVELNSIEISDYCNNLFSIKENIDKCIDDYQDN